MHLPLFRAKLKAQKGKEVDMVDLKIYLDKDINQDLIKSKKIAVIGFGSQGYGQSMNLKDSGCDVVLGLRQVSWLVIKIKCSTFVLHFISIKYRAKWIIWCVNRQMIQNAWYSNHQKSA